MSGWQNYHAVQAVPAGAETNEDLVDLFVEAAEELARSMAGVVEVGESTLEWFEVTEKNRATLEIETRQELEAGDRVAKVTLPCRREG